MKVMFYVQHLLGIGHLVRASRVADALTKVRHDVTVISGGMPVEGFPGAGIEVVYLPPLRSANGSFSELVAQSGEVADEAFKQARTQQLLGVFEALVPDVVLVEAFPFARRQMRFELVPLFEKIADMDASVRPLVGVSVRDILQPKGAKRDAETATFIKQHIDVVLVHGDKNFVRLDETFERAGDIDGRVHYTGIVGPQAAKSDGDAAYDVIVSAGGGAVGQVLLKTAIEAVALTQFADARWLIVAGPNLTDDDYAVLQGKAPANVQIVRFEPRLAALLQQARLSVSQAGYNTVADVLTAGCASVLVPYADSGEQEQTVRAQKLDAMSRCVMVASDDLSAGILAKAMDDAVSLVGADKHYVPRLGGAQKSVEILERCYEDFRHGRSA